MSKDQSNRGPIRLLPSRPTARFPPCIRAGSVSRDPQGYKWRAGTAACVSSSAASWPQPATGQQALSLHPAVLDGAASALNRLKFTCWFVFCVRLSAVCHFELWLHLNLVVRDCFLWYEASLSAEPWALSLGLFFFFFFRGSANGRKKKVLFGSFKKFIFVK